MEIFLSSVLKFNVTREIGNSYVVRGTRNRAESYIANGGQGFNKGTQKQNIAKL